jgi:hypothetical protein
MDKYLGIQDPDEVQQVKIGILQESPFLPLSDSVKRAIKQTERSLKDMGYYVVPFFLTDEVWAQARQYMNAIVANGFLDKILKDLEIECESHQIRKPHGQRWFVRGREEQSEIGFQKMSPKEFEMLLKKRDELIAQVSSKW